MSNVLSRLARQVQRAMVKSGVAQVATLIKVTPGTRTPGSLSAGTNPGTANYAAKGWLDDFDNREIDGTIVVQGDRKIMLLGTSIASSKIPAPDDEVSIGGSKYRIRRVESDPANAVFICQTLGPALP
jgi:hypothetical protein